MRERIKPLAAGVDAEREGHRECVPVDFPWDLACVAQKDWENVAVDRHFARLFAAGAAFGTLVGSRNDGFRGAGRRAQAQLRGGNSGDLGRNARNFSAKIMLDLKNAEDGFTTRASAAYS